MSTPPTLERPSQPVERQAVPDDNQPLSAGTLQRPLPENPMQPPTVESEVESIDARLHQAEDRLSASAAELVAGFHTKAEKARFGQDIEAYAAIVGTAAKEKAGELSQAGEPSSLVKHLTIDMLLDSQREVLGDEVELRLGQSLWQRSKEAIGRSKIRRGIAKLAMTGAEVGVVYLAWKGVFGENVEQVTENLPWEVAAGPFALHYGLKAAGEMVGKHADEEIDEFTPEVSTDPLAESPEKPAETSFQLANHAAYLEAMEGKLYTIAGQGFHEDNFDTGRFVDILVGEVIGSLEEFYGVGKEDDRVGEGIRHSAAIVSTGIMEAGKIDKDTAEALSELIPEKLFK